MFSVMFPLFVFTFLLTAFVVYQVYHKLTCGVCSCDVAMRGKVVIVTGANTGIGRATALRLARRGAKVVLACRDPDKGVAARDRITKETANEEVVFKRLDLASFRSVRAFADDILKTEPRLHVLINNAGVGRQDNSLTEDNLPVEAQVNHFGPFLLTTLLLPLLKASAPSRVVNVSCGLHRIGAMEVDTFARPAASAADRKLVYPNTKLASVLFAERLSRELRGTGVTANSLNPGPVCTELFRKRLFVVRLLIKLLFKSPEQGAQTSVHVALAPDLVNVTGKYFAECKQELPSDAAQDRRLADSLWALSEHVTHTAKQD